MFKTLPIETELNIPLVKSAKMINISANIAGQRIDNFLLRQLKNIPKNTIYRILRRGEVRVNKKRIKPKYKLNIGDKVRIPPIQILKHKEKRIPYIKNISILNNIFLYEDNHIIAINKPSGIAVHGGSGLSFGIIEYLRVIRPEESFLELVHRLDYDTSGVLLVAKRRSSLNSLHSQLREKKVHKNYLALVRGQWRSCIKTIQAPLLKNIMRNGERIVQVSQKGKPSETHFKVEEYYKFATLLRCNPITGRTHQIRVHAKYAGHPIALDNRYGDHSFNKQLAQIGLLRLFLHAAALKFTHPDTGKIIHIKAPLDEQLKMCLKLLRS